MICIYVCVCARALLMQMQIYDYMCKGFVQPSCGSLVAGAAAIPIPKWSSEVNCRPSVGRCKQCRKLEEFNGLWMRIYAKNDCLLGCLVAGQFS